MSSFLPLLYVWLKPRLLTAFLSVVVEPSGCLSHMDTEALTKQGALCKFSFYGYTKTKLQLLIFRKLAEAYSQMSEMGRDKF